MPRQKYLLSPRSFKEFFILPHLWFITLRVATISITKGNIVMNDPPHIYWAYIILRRRFSWTSWWGLFWNYIIYTLLRHSYVWQSKVSIVSMFYCGLPTRGFSMLADNRNAHSSTKKGVVPGNAGASFLQLNSFLLKTLNTFTLYSIEINKIPLVMNIMKMLHI